VNAVQAAPRLARKLNAFDATLVVMGGIVGAGIFMNPSVVAQRAHTTQLIMAAWLFGGLVSLAGGFIFAELAWRRPSAGGLYGYMRDAFHPVVAFMYGWTALLVSQSGGMAAAAVTFAAYFQPLTALHWPAKVSAIGAIALLSFINCTGVREGGTTQNIFMILKVAVIAAVIGAGLSGSHPASAHQAAAASVVPGGLLPILAIMGASLVPVLYAYDGWQTAPFIDGELKDPARTLPSGMILGVIAVVVLYLVMTIAALVMLGPHGLAATSTPASDIMAAVFGPAGQRIVAAGVALSTLGFLSNQVLTSPRIYYAMARDGLFFKQLASVHPRTQAPVVAIAVQAIAGIAITLWGRYDQILNYVLSMDFIFLTLAAVALFIFRRRRAVTEPGPLVPGHPWTTLFFIAAGVAIIVNTVVTYPRDTLIGLLILFSGAPIYLIWHRRSRFAASAPA